MENTLESRFEDIKNQIYDPDTETFDEVALLVFLKSEIAAAEGRKDKEYNDKGIYIADANGFIEKTMLPESAIELARAEQQEIDAGVVEKLKGGGRVISGSIGPLFDSGMQSGYDLALNHATRAIREIREIRGK